MGDFTEDDFGNERIDWDLELDWQDETLEEMYYQGDEMLGNKRELNAGQLVYNYEWIDLKAAAADRGRSPRNSFIRKEKVQHLSRYTVLDKRFRLFL